MKCQERCSTFCLNGALTKKVCAATGAGSGWPGPLALPWRLALAHTTDLDWEERGYPETLSGVRWVD